MHTKHFLLSKRTHDDGPATFITASSTGNMLAPMQWLHNG